MSTQGRYTSIVEHMGFSDLIRAAEHKINTYGVRRKTRAGWLPKIVPYTGYGTTDRVHVIGRILMDDPTFDDSDATAPGSRRTAAGQVENFAHEAQRGYRQFFTVQVGDHPVQVHVGGEVVQTYTDSNGYFDVSIVGHGLEPGWGEVDVTAEGAEAVTAKVLITSSEETIGLISDIDDTIMVTNLPRALHAAYNSWFKKTNNRQPIPGMARLYSELLKDHPNAPVFYLSTGAWNTFHTLEQFIDDNNLPQGPLLLTDWGPTPTGLFRNGSEHKKVQLRNLIIDYPNIKWILVGDNGQHDPLNYGDLAIEHPGAVAGIAIRELTPTEHMLSHGTMSSLTGPPRTNRDAVPTIYGPDGHALLREYRQQPFA